MIVVKYFITKNMWDYLRKTFITNYYVWKLNFDVSISNFDKLIMLDK